MTPKKIDKLLSALASLENTVNQIVESNTMTDEQQLINLKRNLESGIVFDITPEIRDVLDNYSGLELKRQIIKVKEISPELMYILCNYKTNEL